MSRAPRRGAVVAVLLLAASPTRAAEVAEPLRRWGQVTVLDDQGEVKQTLEAAGAESAPAPETSEE